MQYTTFMIAASAAASIASAQVPPGYAITDLGTLGGDSSIAYGLNESGQVVGSARDASGVDRPAIWTDGVISALPDEGFGGVAYGVNASGHATGAIKNGDTYTRPWDNRTFGVDNVALWDDTGLTNLGNLGGLSRGEGRFVTDDGWIGGTASAPLPNVAGEDIWQRGFIKTASDSSIRDIGGFPGDLRSFIFDINDARQAPGFSEDGNRGHQDDRTKAALWQFDDSGGVQSVTALDPIASGRLSLAVGINNLSDVVGRSVTADGQDVTVIWENGSTTPTLLPVLDTDAGSYVRAWQINDDRTIVGELRAGSDSNIRFATLWADDGNGFDRIDLQDLIDPTLGWDLQGALSINESGQIVGYGNIGGEQRAFLLTPIPEPASSSVLGLAGVALLRRRR
jgi:uncharacterized membrane protein